MLTIFCLRRSAEAGEASTKMQEKLCGTVTIPDRQAEAVNVRKHRAVVRLFVEPQDPDIANLAPMFDELGHCLYSGAQRMFRFYSEEGVAHY